MHPLSRRSTRRPKFRAFLALLVLAFPGGTLTAQEATDPRVARAVVAYQAGDLTAALAVLDSVPPDVSASDRAIVHLYRGLIAFIRDDIDEVRASFALALDENPSLRLDPTVHSPSRIQLFEQVRAAQIAEWRRLAVAAESRDERSQALEHWSAVLSAAPDDVEAREAIGRLAGADPPARQQVAEPERRAAAPPPAPPPVSERSSSNLSATTAALLGVAVPGGGEFYVGRPLRGALVLGGSAAALAAGFLITRLEVDCRSVPQNGVCPPEDLLGETETRPYLTPAIAAAALLTMAGAIDAALGVSGPRGSGGLSSRVESTNDGGVDITLLRFRR